MGVKPVIKGKEVVSKNTGFDIFKNIHLFFDKTLKVENITDNSKLDQILKILSNQNLNLKIMATLAEVKQDLVDLQTSVDANQAKVIAEIQALKDQIAAGGTITAADLDDLAATIKGIQTDVDTTDEG